MPVLPFKPPLAPMLSKLSAKIPAGDGWLHEPKWDGFRAILFKDGDDIYLQSRDLKPLSRYFPELVEGLRAQLPAAIVLDGEIVIAAGGALDFESLLLRIHPAESRINVLSQQTPTSFVAWDCLALGKDDLRQRPLWERKAMLERELAKRKPPLFLTPATTEEKKAQGWFEHFEGAGLDGVVSKRLDGPYVAGQRVMVKTKHVRAADCVVAGFRWYRKGGKVTKTAVGSLLLGLYDDSGELHHLGICAAFTMAKRAELAQMLEPYRRDAAEQHPWRKWAGDASFGVEGNDAEKSALDAGEDVSNAPAARRPGMTSRWNRGKDLSWQPIRLELVCEVKYDHLQGDRFRHATHFLRWRPDKRPADCRYGQLDVTPPHELAAIFATNAAHSDR